MMTSAMAGENINISIGTLRAGDSVTVTFQVTVNNPPNLTLLSPPRVRNQGTVSGSNFANVLTDDTAVGGGADEVAARHRERHPGLRLPPQRLGGVLRRERQHEHAAARAEAGGGGGEERGHGGGVGGW